MAGNFLYMAYYGCACRMAPFFSTARYTIGPVFFLDWYMKGPTFSDIRVYAHFFHSEIFEAACSLDIQ